MAAPEVIRRLAAIHCADVKGYSRLMADDKAAEKSGHSEGGGGQAISNWGVISQKGERYFAAALWALVCSSNS